MLAQPSLEPSAGRIWFDGAPVTFASPADAKALGIETVYQDLSLCPNVDTVANFFMGRELHRNLLGFRFLRERAMQAETERALADDRVVAVNANPLVDAATKAGVVEPAASATSCSVRSFLIATSGSGKSGSRAISAKASACSPSPARIAMPSPNTTCEVGRPRRRSSSSMAGRSSCTSE